MSVRPQLTATVTVTGLTLETPQRVLLDDVSFSLPAGRHVALVGRNGSGKTSLLAAIASRFGSGRPAHARVSGGTIAVAPGATAALVAQHPERRDDSDTAANFVDARAGAAAVASRRYTARPGPQSLHRSGAEPASSVPGRLARPWGQTADERVSRAAATAATG